MCTQYTIINNIKYKSHKYSDNHNVWKPLCWLEYVSCPCVPPLTSPCRGRPRHAEVRRFASQTELRPTSACSEAPRPCRWSRRAWLPRRVVDPPRSRWTCRWRRSSQQIPSAVERPRQQISWRKNLIYLKIWFWDEKLTGPGSRERQSGRRASGSGWTPGCSSSPEQ